MQLGSRAWFDNPENPGMTAIHAGHSPDLGLTLDEPQSGKTGAQADTAPSSSTPDDPKVFEPRGGVEGTEEDPARIDKSALEIDGGCALVSRAAGWRCCRSRPVTVSGWICASAKRRMCAPQANAPGGARDATWQETHCGVVDPCDKGMTLKPAVKHQQLVQKGMPRDNH